MRNTPGLRSEAEADAGEGLDAKDALAKMRATLQVWGCRLPDQFGSLVVLRIGDCAKAEATQAVAELQAIGESDIAIDPSEPREVRELKQIVNGIRAEMREYLANGNGTIRSFWRRLLERTRQEAQIYERTRRELENEKSHAVWERKNDALRRLGLRTIPNPQDDE